MIDGLIDETRIRMDKSIHSLTERLNGIRTGRASLALIEKIQVSYYGTMTPLNQVASLSVPDSRTVLIQPWDKTALPEVEKAISKSDLGINPMNDGTIVRLNFPQLTEERRREMTKVVKKIGEEAKVAIRAIRRDINEDLKKQGKTSELSEDEVKRSQDTVQKITDELIEHIDELIVDKEAEIMEV